MVRVNDADYYVDQSMRLGQVGNDSPNTNTLTFNNTFDDTLYISSCSVAACCGLIRFAALVA